MSVYLLDCIWDVPLKMSEAPVLCIKKGQHVGNLKLACLTNLVLFIGSFPCKTWVWVPPEIHGKIRLLENCGDLEMSNSFGGKARARWISLIFWLAAYLNNVPKITPTIQNVSSPIKSNAQGARTTVTDPAHPGGPARRVWGSGVGLVCLGAVGNYGFLLVVVSSKDSPNRERRWEKSVQNLWTSKKP